MERDPGCSVFVACSDSWTDSISSSRNFYIGIVNPLLAKPAEELAQAGSSAHLCSWNICQCSCAQVFNFLRWIVLFNGRLFDLPYSEWQMVEMGSISWL